MLQQLLVLSPYGPLFAYRNYIEQNSKLDPQLVSAVVSTSKDGISLKTISEILQKELDEKETLSIAVDNSHNYITCALSTNHADSKNVRKILPKINRMMYEIMGNSHNLITVEPSKKEKVEHGIDILMLKEGLIEK